MNKRLIASMCLAAMVMSTPALTGCENQTTENTDSYLRAVVDFNDNAILHKLTYCNEGARASNFSYYEFGCGETLKINGDVITSFNDIDKKYYDEVCPKCFSEEEIERLSK